MNNEISLGTWLSLYSEAIAEVLVNARIDQGYNFIAFSVDFRMLDVMARKPFNND